MYVRRSLHLGAALPYLRNLWVANDFLASAPSVNSVAFPI